MTAKLRLVTDADLPPAATYGEPVILTFADGQVDLGAEDRDGQRIIRLVLEDEDDLTHLALFPAEARRPAAELTRLADG